MTEYYNVKVKLSGSQTNKLYCARKNTTSLTLRLPSHRTVTDEK